MAAEPPDEAVEFGLVVGWSCVVTCSAIMTATVAAAHDVAVMAVLFGVQFRDRLGRRLGWGGSAPVVAGLGIVLVGAQLLPG